MRPSLPSRPSPRSGALALLLLVLPACAGSGLRDNVDETQTRITTARKNGAIRCAPVELAKAEAHADFAREELSEGNYFEARRQSQLARDNADLAVEKSPPERCAPKGEEPVPVVGDRDGDGILDDVDLCKDKPEDKDDFEDADGCPDNPDPDGDKIIGSADSCPMEAEDLDSFSDSDGCPDPDNDNDTVLDVVDECPLVPGKVELKGCPEPDRDGDTIIDRLDNCPDEPGTVENQGCKAKQVVKITDSKIEILDIVYFALNRAVIEKRSFALLDEVARVIGGHPEISKVRIEGHTDNQGNDVYNKKLSQRRADAVKAYLVKKGVAAERLDAVGFGEEQPKTENDTKEGRATNRRVEFIIVGGSGIEVKSTGPAEDTIEKDGKK